MNPQPTVLIIDDDDDHRFITARALERIRTQPEFRVEEAPGGGEGLRALARLVSQGSPVLVLCDYKMPTMNGLDVLRIACATHARDAFCFVLFTSVELADVQTESRRLGADQLIVKPMEFGQFRQRLEPALSRWIASAVPPRWALRARAS